MIVDLFSKRTSNRFHPSRFIVEGGKKEQLRKIFNSLMSRDRLWIYSFGLGYDMRPTHQHSVPYKYILTIGEIEDLSEEEIWNLPAVKPFLNKLLDWFRQADPTGKSYVDQIIKWWDNESINFPIPEEDIEQVREQLEIFERYKGSEYISEKNINKYPRFSDLADVTLPLHRKAVTTRYKPNGSFVDEEDNEYKLYITENPKQAKDLGSGTTWCIQQPKWWKDYSENAPVAIVTVNDEPTYGIAHNGTEWEIQDPSNAPHNFFSKNKINQWLWEIYKPFYFEAGKKYDKWFGDKGRENDFILYNFSQDMGARAPVEQEKSFIEHTESIAYDDDDSPQLFLSMYMYNIFVPYAFSNVNIDNEEHLLPYLSYRWNTLSEYAKIPNSDNDYVTEALAKIISDEHSSQLPADPNVFMKFINENFGGDIPPMVWETLQKEWPGYLHKIYLNYPDPPQFPSEAAMEEAEDMLSQQQCNNCGHVGLTSTLGENNSIVGFCEQCETEQ